MKGKHTSQACQIGGKPIAISEIMPVKKSNLQLLPFILAQFWKLMNRWFHKKNILLITLLFIFVFRKLQICIFWWGLNIHGADR